MKSLWMVALLMLAASSPVVAADWGSLKGRLVFDGDAGTPEAINVNKDVEFCSKHKPVDERLTVGDDGGLSNVFVYLYVKKGKSVPVHPDMESPSEEAAVLDNNGCRFEPHAMTVRVGQEMQIKNSDTIAHNTNAGALLSNPSFNNTVPQNEPLSKVFEKTESYPSEFACNIHPWMKSYVLIRNNPYMAVTDSAGNFEIKNLPAGKHEFIFWHGPNGNIKSLKVGGTKTSRKGRAKLQIPAGDTLDLGEVKVSGKALGM
ncbi:MAG: hypothetical protein AAGD11_10570 [Planctomycetota bacterium]